MQCDKCHDQLSDLLDNTLVGDDRKLLDAHLEECATCTGMHGDLNRIIALAREEREHALAPADGQALWLRIREHVESDIEWAREARTVATTAASASQGSWWTRFWQAQWQISAPQVTGAFATLAGLAVLGVAFGTSILRNPATDPGSLGTQALAPVSGARRVALDEHLRRQQADIEYLRQRVEENKSRLPPRVRESFERTMVRLDQDVNLSLEQLHQNPQDDVSEQMLNRALQDKVEILRELSSEF